MFPSIAHAAAGAGGAGGGPKDMYSTLVLFGLMALIFYFFLIRPQSKKQKDHQAMLNDLKRGDEVFTAGGLIGKVHSVTDKLIVLEVAQNTRIRVLKGHVQGKVQAEAGEKEE
jgi:preprotein translocase subunit YajC